MPKLGNKFNKSTKQLGNKIDKGAHRIGNKMNFALSKSNGVMRKIDNTLSDARNNGAGLLPVVGQAITMAGLASHVGHKITQNAHNNELEKHNRRKAKEEALLSASGGAFV